MKSSRTSKTQTGGSGFSTTAESYTRDAYHQVTRIDYPDGSNEQFTYNDFGQTLTHTLRSGGVEQFTYDAQGRKTSALDPLGNRIIYGYVNSTTGTTNDLPVVMVDARGNATQYEYNDRGQTTKITHPDGSVRLAAYDAFGNKITETDELGCVTQWQYDAFRRIVTNINALGCATVYSYNLPGGGCGCAHAERKPTKIISPSGKTTTISYDLMWQKLSETVAYGTADAATTQYQYDPNGNLLATIDPLGQAWTFAYDARNRRITSRDPLGNTTQWSYDANGNRTRQIDANGKYTYWTYDAMNRVLQQIRKEGDTNPQPDNTDAVTRYTYDSAGNVLSATDPNGNATSYQYDLLSRRVRATTAANETSSTYYDAVGNIVTNIAPNGNVTISVYDEENRLAQTRDSVGLVAQFTYDAKGNRLTQTDGNGNTTAYTYDAAGRMTAVTDALGHGTVNQYDNDDNVIRVTDRNNRATQYGYDNRNRRVTVTDALGNITRTSYNANNNVVSVTDANNHATSYGYDAANRKTSETYPDAAPNTVSFTYDGVGNVLTKTDQKGQVTTFTYNDLYYLMSRSVPGFPADVYTYDVSGRMLTATRNGWQVTFQYDAVNRVIQNTQNGLTIGYSYNVAAGTRTITYPSGRVVTERMDLRGRLGTVQDADVIAQYSYDLGNRVTQRAYANGVTAGYAYNANNWLTVLDHQRNGARVVGFGYGYDAEGNKLSEQKLHQSGNSEAYAYDAVNRLTSYRVGTLSGNTVASPLTQSAWNLDSVGNWNSRVKDGATELRSHNAANAITMISGVGVTSDNNGNLTQDLQNQYQYDEGNRLVLVAQASVPVGNYAYDALGRRISKTTAAGTTVFYYDAARIIEERVSGATSATYVYGNYVDEVLAKDTSGQRLFYHQNALWSVHALTDAAGAVVERYSYDAYGQLSVLSPTYQLLTTAPLAYFTFTGREFDAECGIFHYRARCYSPSLGRFLHRDPIGYVDGMNLYEYVGSKPVDKTDPDGLWAFEWVNGFNPNYMALSISGIRNDQRVIIKADASGWVIDHPDEDKRSISEHIFAVIQNASWRTFAGETRPYLPLPTVFHAGSCGQVEFNVVGKVTPRYANPFRKKYRATFFWTISDHGPSASEMSNFGNIVNTTTLSLSIRLKWTFDDTFPELATDPHVEDGPNREEHGISRDENPIWY